MTPQKITERLLEQYDKPDFEPLVQELQPLMTVELIAYLKKRVDEEKLKDAHLALRIATLAQSLVPYISEPEAEALAYAAKGGALLQRSEFKAALKSYQVAADIYAAQNQYLDLVEVQMSMVPTLRNLGDSQGALALAEQVRAGCLALGKPAQRTLAGLEMNVGVIYRQLGNLDAAIKAYERGRAIFIQLGDEINAARMDINRAYVYQLTSRFITAQELLEGARRTLAQTGQHAQQVARTEAMLGLVASRCGRYQEALTHFEAARRGFAGLDTLIAIVDLRRCFIYHKLNLISEMINRAQAAEPIFTQNSMFEEQALALHQLGLGYQRSGAYTLALAYLKQARQIFEEQEVRAKVFELDYDLAYLTYIMGRIDEAWKLAHPLSKQVESDTWPQLAAQTRILLARCALAREPERARHEAQAALELSLAYSLHEPPIAAHHLMGQIAENYDKPDDAWAHYQTAIELIESLRLQLLVDEFRIGFMDDKLPIYADAVRLSQQMGTPAQLLYTLNLAHTAPLPHLPIVSLTDLSNSELESELITLREKWHWYQNKLEEASNDKDGATTVGELRQELNKVEAELAELSYRLRLSQSSVNAAKVEPVAISQLWAADVAAQFLTDIQHRLQPNEILLHYYLVNDTLQALLVTPKAIHIFPDLASTKSLGRILRGWNRQLRHIGLISQAPQTSQSLAQRYLSHFHQALVKPLASHLTPQSHLFVIMPPGWHDLPLSAFFDGQHHLIEQHQITYLSAPSAKGRQGERAKGHPLASSPTPGSDPTKPLSHQPTNPQALIVGHSDDGRLRGTLQAAQRVAEGLPSSWQSTLLMDEEATFEKFQAASRKSHLIHLATHAIFRPDNPLFSWAQLAKHRLTVADLYQMKLPQRPLVILSACETGRGQARGGGLLGMGRALLAAGASGVMVTLWRVEDQATAQLMSDFYSVIGQDEALENAWAYKASASLRQAQLQAIAKRLHPFFWAAFIVMKA
jgi:CHAT domain-containing protein